ncbi:hypothetical protein [Candidatus Bathycorpusculum sp.]|uniref:hypothetical protein n=1 Tax=Candidatus Bathycorpusculum sp. TaxID=2994959 RepID=UPI002818BC6C|nr:hypothetical protein [Candidatus Termitimicrobium sp.]MCL2686610.1 hypothetical protein [Candidatus Termitimicrobium sp.]
MIGDKVGLQSNFDMLAEDKNTPKQNHNYTVNHSIFPIAQPRIQIKGNPLDNNPNKRQRDEVTDNLTLQLLKNNLLIRLK